MSENKTIYLSGIMDRMNSLSDGTWKVTIHLNEIGPETVGELSTYNRQYVYVGMKREDFLNAEKEVLESLESDENTGKTPGQRLRSVLYRNWLQHPGGYRDFDSYYRAMMERMIENWKQKLT